MTPNQVHRLVRALRRGKFPPPAADCLSPAGEYNLRLGILKEVAPELVATHRQAVSTCEGHPFIVEAGVSLGGKSAKEGITVYRFANRIPLLFEAGGDVVTRTAQKRIKYAAAVVVCVLRACGPGRLFHPQHPPPLAVQLVVLQNRPPQGKGGRVCVHREHQDSLQRHRQRVHWGRRGGNRVRREVCAAGVLPAGSFPVLVSHRDCCCATPVTTTCCASCE